jgi:riboflavin synthase
VFSGIVAATGRIAHLQTLEKGLRLTVEAPGLDLADVAVGDSIAHGGVCLTVIEKAGRRTRSTSRARRWTAPSASTRRAK